MHIRIKPTNINGVEFNQRTNQEQILKKKKKFTQQNLLLSRKDGK